MNDKRTAAGQETAPAGKKLFYRQPELLNFESHGSLGLRVPARPFDFARKSRVVPLTLTEIPSAQKFYPVVFSDLENPIPLAVVGTMDDVNLFITDDGNWKRDTYVPGYVRCYPLALAERADDEFAVVVDRAAESVSEDPEQPFFGEDKKVTPEIEELIDFCGRFEAETKRTAQFGMRLKELGLLAGQQVTRKTPEGEEMAVANYVAVDSEKLNGLEGAELRELFSQGYLAAVFAHLFSLENWQLMIERMAAREARASH
jgi:hypothetical protein